MNYQQQSQLIAQGGSTESLNVLCLDGGGVRGLSSLFILKFIFRELSFPYYTPSKSIRPCEIFDIICGTSTGGIIALMLGRLRMSIDEAIDAYIDLAKTVFGKEGAQATDDPKSDLSTLEKWINKILGYDYFSRTVSEENKATDLPLYDASKLEECIKDIVSKKTGDMHTPLSDESAPCCHTFVVALCKGHADAPPKLFRTYWENGKSADCCKIWEAARATTAAAPFFEPATFGIPPSTHADDELSGSNNPSRLAIEEVERIFPSRQIGCLLSLGTGIADFISVPEEERKVADACETILKSCQKVHQETFKLFKTRLAKGYIRLSLDRWSSNAPLNEWARKDELTGLLEGYLFLGEVRPRVTECITILKERAEVIKCPR